MFVLLVLKIHLLIVSNFVSKLFVNFTYFLKLTFVPPTPEKGSTISCNLRIRAVTSPNCEFPVYIEARYLICFSVNVSICLIFFSLFIRYLMLFIIFLILRSNNFTIDKYRIWFEFYYDFYLIAILHNISIKCNFVFCFYYIWKSNSMKLNFVSQFYGYYILIYFNAVGFWCFSALPSLKSITSNPDLDVTILSSENFTLRGVSKVYMMPVKLSQSDDIRSGSIYEFCLQAR